MKFGIKRNMRKTIDFQLNINLNRHINAMTSQRLNGWVMLNKSKHLMAKKNQPDIFHQTQLRENPVSKEWAWKMCKIKQTLAIVIFKMILKF